MSVARNLQKVKVAEADIRKTAADPQCVQSYTYDLSSLEQVRQFADEVGCDHPAIDVLINNAGTLISVTCRDTYSCWLSSHWLEPSAACA